jgi:hypothetical protein
MTNRSWAIKFVTDMLYEINTNRAGIHHCSKHKCRETALRHFPKEIKRLIRRQELSRSVGWEDHRSLTLNHETQDCDWRTDCPSI